MDPAEVLAIEVKQFVGESLKTLVPRVLGQTETARQKKNVDRGESRQWDEPSFFLDLSQRRGDQEAAVARRLLEWAKKHGLRIWWGEGKKDGSFFPMYDNKFGKNFLFSVWTYGTVELQFQHMRLPPFAEAEKRKELAHRLSAIQGLSIPEEALNKTTVVRSQLAIGPGSPGQVPGSLRLGAHGDQEGRDHEGPRSPLTSTHPRVRTTEHPHDPRSRRLRTVLQAAQGADALRQPAAQDRQAASQVGEGDRRPSARRPAQGPRRPGRSTSTSSTPSSRRTRTSSTRTNWASCGRGKTSWRASSTSCGT